MDEIRTDRRVERTRIALLQSFVDLLLEHGYDAVTVDAVAQRANVGRSTFYVHFRGKEDALRHSMSMPNSGLARMLDKDATAAQFVPLLEHFHSQRRLNRVFFEMPVRSLWIRNLAVILEPKLAQRYCAHPLLPLPLAALHLAELEVGLVALWLLGRHSLKPQTVAEALLASVRAAAAALLPA